MVRYLRCLAPAPLALSLLLMGGLAPAQTDAAECASYGTSVDFFDSPAEAAKQALKEEKLVFVLHVSGNFEVSEFT